MGVKPYNEREYNRLCAEFLDYEVVQTKSGEPLYKIGEYEYYLHKLRFHSDWNWIMQVVEKIESLLHRPNELDTPIYCVTNFRNIVKIETVNDEIVWVKRSSKKEAFIQAIWEFLQWYNEQK